MTFRFLYCSTVHFKALHTGQGTGYFCSEKSVVPGGINKEDDKEVNGNGKFIFNNLIHLKSVSPNAIYRAETKSGNHLVIMNIYFIAMTDFIHLFIFKLISFCHA